jgi:hypothetical protein
MFEKVDSGRTILGRLRALFNMRSFCDELAQTLESRKAFG